MNSGKTIFAQLMDFLPTYEFHQCVQRYNGNYKIKRLFLLGPVSLHGLCSTDLSGKPARYRSLSALGSTETLSHGHPGQRLTQYPGPCQRGRDWRIYADFAQILIGQARYLYASDSFGVELNQTVYALDSTTIDLCLSLFPWAKFRQRKGAIKLHTLLDLRGNIPTVVIITHGKVHDVNILDQLIFEAGAFYIMDRGYLDFARLHAFIRHRRVLCHPRQKQLPLQTPSTPGRSTNPPACASTKPLC